MPMCRRYSSLLGILICVYSVNAQVTLKLGDIVGETSITDKSPFTFVFNGTSKDTVSIPVNDFVNSRYCGVIRMAGSTTPLNGTCTSTNGGSVVNLQLPANGKYEVEISTTTAGTSRFWMVLACDGPCSEPAPSGTPAATLLPAVPLQIPQPQSGLLRTSEKVLRFDVPVTPENRYEVQLKRTSGSAAPRFFLYDQGGKYLAGASSPSSAERSQTFRPAVAGRHQIVIFEQGYNLDFPYSLAVNCLVPCTTPTPPSAPGVSLKLGDIVGETAIGPTGSYHFLFNGTSSDRISVPVNDLGNSFFCATLKAPGGQELSSKCSSASGDSLINMALPVTGTYEGDISTTTTNGGRFWMVLACDGPCATSPPAGPSGAVLPAIPLPLDKDQSGQLTTTEKILRFDLAVIPANSYKITFTRTSGSGAPRFFLYERSGKYVSGVISSTTAIRTQTFRPAASGNHQIVIFEEGYDANLPYTLRVACEIPCVGEPTSTDISVSPATVRIKYVPGGADQQIPFTVRTSVPGAAVRVEKINAPWLNLRQGILIAPGVVRVDVRPGQATTGSTGTLRFSLNSGIGTPVDVKVELVSEAVAGQSFKIETDPVQLSVAPGKPRSTLVAVRSTSASSITVSAASQLPSSVLSVTPASATIPPGEVQNFELTASGALSQESLRAAVTFASPTETKVLDVALVQIDDDSIAVRVAPSALTLFASRRWPEILYVWNSGNRAVRWDAIVDSTNLVIAPTSKNILPGSEADRIEVRLAESTGNLAASFAANLVLTVASQPLQVPITGLPTNVAAPVIQVDKAGVLIDTAGASKILQVANTSTTSIANLTFRAAESWLLVNDVPASNSTAISIPTVASINVRLAVSSASPPPAGSRAFLTITAAPTESRTVEVVFLGAQLAEESTSSGESRKGALVSTLAACTSPRLSVLSTGFSVGASFLRSLPQTVEVLAVDACGNPLTEGNVLLSFSSDEPTQSLVHFGRGVWRTTWQPASSGDVVLRFLASSKATGSSGETSIGVNVIAQQRAPIVRASGLVNGAGFRPLGGTVAGGTWVTIFGTDLAESEAKPAGVLTTSLGGAQVRLGSEKLLLSYASPTQINAFVPRELAVGGQYPLIVDRTGSSSVPVTLTLITADPGIFLYDGTTNVIALAADGAFINQGRPARPGETLVIYGTGLGAVEPKGTSTIAAPQSPLSSVVNKVRVLVNGVDATVPFAGPSPGSIGLYQINFEVPPGAATGNGQLRVSVGGIEGKAMVLPIGR